MRFYEKHANALVVYGINKINGVFYKLFLIENDQKLSRDDISHTSCSDHQSQISSVKKTLDTYFSSKSGKGISVSLNEAIRILEQVIKNKKNLKRIESYDRKQREKQYYGEEQKVVRRFSQDSTASTHDSVNGKKKIHKRRIWRKTGGLSCKF